MAKPVLINAHGGTGLRLAAGVTTYPGDLLTPAGVLAEGLLNPDGQISRPAQFISLAVSTSGLSPTIPVCRSAVFYDSDGFTTPTVYLGSAGQLTGHPDDVSQLVGFVTSPYYASISLSLTDGLISASDLAALSDLSLVLQTNQADFGGLGELLAYLKAARGAVPI